MNSGLRIPVLFVVRRVWRYRKRLPETRDRKAWLARIAWRVALDRRRNPAEISLAAAAEAVYKLYAAGERAEKIACDKQMAVLLDQLIATLPDKLRDPMLLLLDRELSQAEITDELGAIIRKASISLEDGEGRKLSAQTDGAGQFRFTGLR